MIRGWSSWSYTTPDPFSISQKTFSSVSLSIHIVYKLLVYNTLFEYTIQSLFIVIITDDNKQ